MKDKPLRKYFLLPKRFNLFSLIKIIMLVIIFISLFLILHERDTQVKELQYNIEKYRYLLYKYAKEPVVLDSTGFANWKSRKYSGVSTPNITHGGKHEFGRTDP